MRITPIVPGSRPELAEIEASIVARRGSVTTIYQVLMNSPAIAVGWERLLFAVRRESSLTARLRELVILQIAMLNGAPYEFEAHAPIASAAGLDDVLELLRRSAPIPAGRLTEQECIALELTEAMTRQVEVPDELFEKVHRHFQDQSLIDLTVTIAAYNMVSRFLVALRVGH